MTDQELIIELTRRVMELERHNKNHFKWWQEEKEHNDTLQIELKKLKNK